MAYARDKRSLKASLSAKAFPRVQVSGQLTKVNYVEPVSASLMYVDVTHLGGGLEIIAGFRQFNANADRFLVICRIR